MWILITFCVKLWAEIDRRKEVTDRKADAVQSDNYNTLTWETEK